MPVMFMRTGVCCGHHADCRHEVVSSRSVARAEGRYLKGAPMAGQPQVNEPAAASSIGCVRSSAEPVAR